MKIRISDLPPQGLPITGEISLDALNSRLHQGNPSDIRFSSAPQVAITATPNADGAEVVGTVKTKYFQACGRCTDEIERELEVDLSYIVKPNPTEPLAEENEGFADDVGMLFFSGEYIELEEAIQESLIVSLSLYWSPDLDKTGKCTICRKSSTFEDSVAESGKASFAALLKKAGVN